MSFLDLPGLKHFIDKSIGKNDISGIGDGTLTGAVAAVNNKLNPLSAAYITGSIDETINKYADGAPYIFGHSETLNSLLGYWVIVITIGHVTQDNNKYYAQVAIGQNGKSATRFYTSSNSWSSWVS